MSGFVKPVVVEPSTHAKKYPPSSLKAIRLCNAYKPQSTSSAYAAEGTAAHTVAQTALEGGFEAYELVGTVYDIEDHHITVTPEMARHVQVGYIELVLARADGNPVLVEQKLPLINVTGEDDTGTADAVILHDRAITIVDLKYGMGVKVDAKDNDQLMAYALAAIHAYEHRTGEVEFVDLVIVQPRLNHVSEWRVTREELEAFGVRLAIMIDRIEHGEVKATPGAEQCRWCENAPTCSALYSHTLEGVGDDFEDVSLVAENSNEVLAEKYAKLDAIKVWVKAVEDETRRRLMVGESIPGHKLVEGRRGARRWVSADDAEQAMKAMRMRSDFMYERSLISPTTLEKLAKRKIVGPRQWEKLKGLIVQPEGAPAIVTESDPRPALVIDPTAGLFADH